MKTGTFDEALEIIESFPEEQKESIIEIVKRRLTEERRERLHKLLRKRGRNMPVAKSGGAQLMTLCLRLPNETFA